MAKIFAKSFYNSKKWIRCRDSYIQQRMCIDGGMCEVCHAAAGYIVHHKVMLDEYNIKDPDVALNHNNLMYVCKECHDAFEGHGVGKAAARPLCVFDENGQPISVRKIDIAPLETSAPHISKRPSPQH